MNEQEQKYFDQLHAKRVKHSEALMDYENRGIWVNLIDKYTDSAHFIYELLQNADDANATSVEMRLEKDGFLFKHNGTTRFTVSNPETVKQDIKSGRYGHLNALTAIGSSTKPTDLENNKIGKFGIGFKSVFTYTAHPHVYDDVICFRLTDYVIPEQLKEDHAWRKSGETLFYLPFDKKEKSKTKLFSEIEEKLKSLDNPILFLHHLQRISWSTSTKSSEGMYSKEILESEKNGDVLCEHIKLHNFSEDKPEELWMFTRQVKLEEGKFPVSVGYFIDKGKIDTKQRPRIHCFFPTKETLDFCFVMHAPFALVDNREAIKEFEDVNTLLFMELAKLASEALVCLKKIGVKNKNTYIDESIFQIVPLSRMGGYESHNRWRDMFYEAFVGKLKSEEIHLVGNGKYVAAREALKIDNSLKKLLPEDVVSELIYEYEKEGYRYWLNPPHVHYNFVHSGVALRRSEVLVAYFKTIGIKTFYVEDFVEYFTKSFISKQSEQWLLSFYHYLSTNEGQKLITETDEYDYDKVSLREKPIIRNSRGFFVEPYSGSTARVFVLDGTPQEGLEYVDPKLVSNADVLKVLDVLSISAPDIHSIVEKVIYPKYSGKFKFTWEDYNQDFLTILKAYSQTPNGYFVGQVKEHFWFRATCDSLILRNGNLYQDTDLMLRLLIDTGEVYVLDMPYYENFVPKKLHKTLHEFFDTVALPRVLKVEEVERDTEGVLSEDEVQQHEGYKIYYRIKDGKEIRAAELPCAKITDYRIEAFEAIIEKGVLSMDYSVLIWNSYKELLANRYTFNQYAHWDYSYLPYNKGNYKRRHIYRDSALITEAKEFAWLYDKSGVAHKPGDIYIDDLASEYELDDAVIRFLGLEYSPQSQDMALIDQNCSEKTKEDVRIGHMMRRLGLKGTEEDFKKLERLLKEEAKREEEAALEAERKRKRAEEKANIEKLRKESDINDLPKHVQTNYSADQLFDKAPQNLPSTKQRERETNDAPTAEQIEQLQRQKEANDALVAIAKDPSKRYTYEWFNALLELEFEASGEANSNSRGLHIVFSKVERDPNSERGVLLRNPSRFIPRSIEESGNIEVLFYLPDNVHPSISFEVASVQDYVLRLKCKNEDVEKVESLLTVADKIYRAELKTDTPIKLVAELQSAFKGLDYDDDFSMRDNINPTLKFVFGPPGTGKTTHLVKKWINKIASRPRGKMLVLCPTNKAADVIAQRALDKLNPASHPEQWLYRFVATAEDALEPHVCLRDSNVYQQDKCCIISTIARFAYDGFEGEKLKDIDWDYIVIDEASMIPLAEIVYPIYKCQHPQIVVAGDPFQIEPIVSENLWKEENIYKMVQLENFKDPQTVPVQFDITNLPVQYRAVPAIGNLFSEYAYDGGVSSYREQNSQRKLTLKGFEPKSVNFVMFPVERSSIYEPHPVAKSSIHIYSALLTYEFIKYLAKNIDEQKDEKMWRIGVISPYRAQAEIINKLWEQRTESYANVDVQIGTVHGFQGDECDIILAVYNPAASGMKRNAGNVFVNKKNILNVAISRAQDYLFLIMPDGDYEDYNNLEAKSIGVIAKKNKSEMTITTAQALEKVMLNDSNYLDKNTFVTVHQLANVYSAPSSKYEVRFDEKSVDIQVK